MPHARRPAAAWILGGLAAISYAAAAGAGLLWYLEKMQVEPRLLAAYIAGSFILGALLHGFSTALSLLSRIARSITPDAQGAGPERESHDNSSVFTDPSISDARIYEGLYKDRSNP